MLLVAPSFRGVAALYLFPRSSVSWIALPLFWWSGALWTGASLVRIAPRNGMAACATLAVAGQAVLIGFGVTVAAQVETGFVLFYTTGLLVAAPLLVGGAFARRRLIVCRSPRSNSMNRHLLAALCVYSVGCACAAQQMEWRDPSPRRHRSSPSRTMCGWKCSTGAVPVLP